jgi:hypothetical protein
MESPMPPFTQHRPLHLHRRPCLRLLPSHNRPARSVLTRGCQDESGRLLAPAGINGTLLLDQCIAMSASGAVLGPFCDSLHSAGDVLHYTSPTIRSLGPIPLETCW